MTSVELKPEQIWEVRGERVLKFDNGRTERVYAVALFHPPSGNMWERIWVLRDDGELAHRIAFLPYLEAKGQEVDELSARAEGYEEELHSLEQHAEQLEHQLDAIGKIRVELDRRLVSDKELHPAAKAPIAEIAHQLEEVVRNRA